MMLGMIDAWLLIEKIEDNHNDCEKETRIVDAPTKGMLMYNKKRDLLFPQHPVAAQADRWNNWTKGEGPLLQNQLNSDEEDTEEDEDDEEDVYE